ncbi:MAG: HAMP domain-containing histidine kinase [Lachnospiraceae bacterium]|jgi:signal transduction histidine kinase|nr:HAMP domain-containing sensor histidine kinase [uncultured Acetatifactor sp.]MCI9220411.1 HAMP domain-containing histidine kinase [Lachnospiraceae bacterium]
MEILLAVACMLAFYLGFLCVRNRMELRSIYRQLEEVAAGSHIELTVSSRRKPVLALCRQLNLILRNQDSDQLRFRQAQKDLKQNITGLAHDIRTPLTGAFGYVQLAEECGDEVKRAHYLHAAKARLSELEEMLEKMFLYTKLTSEDFELSPERLQVLPLLGDCLLNLYPKFEKTGITPQIAFQSEDFCVMADREALRRVFQNLITNALVHGGGGISISQAGNRLLFKNPLCGTERPNPELMFDKFYKSDRARGRGSSGLGLFIVRELMRKMSGDAEAVLEDENLLITLYFP